MNHTLKVLAVGAAAVFAADYVTSLEFFKTSGPTTQKVMYYGAGGATLLLLHKMLGTPTT